MDAETAIALGFLFISLGFFMLMCKTVSNDSREGWERRMQEQREFGHGKPIQHTVKTLKGK